MKFLKHFEDKKEEEYYMNASNDEETHVRYMGEVLCVNKEKKWLKIGKKYKLFKQETNGCLWTIDDRDNQIELITNDDFEFFDALVDLTRYGFRVKPKNTAHFTMDDNIEEYVLRTTAKKYNI
jgi:hypothetical protein